MFQGTMHVPTSFDLKEKIRMRRERTNQVEFRKGQVESARRL
jgi:hypothetical protein